MYAAEMASGGTIYIPSYMKIGSGIQAMLKLLPQQLGRMQWWYILGGN
jgi:hypothetical protein